MIVWLARSHEQTGIQGKSREWSDPIAASRNNKDWCAGMKSCMKGKD